MLTPLTALSGSGHLLGHGLGGRSDLPLPLSFFIYGASAVLIISFAAVGALWTAPRLRRDAAGREIDGSTGTIKALTAVARIAGLAAAAMALTAAIWGSDNPGTNPTPWLVYIAMWIAGQFASAIFGGVWRAINPLRTLALAAAWLGARIGLVRTEGLPAESRPGGYWPAVAVIFGFHWLELAYHSNSTPSILGWAMAVTTVFVVVPCLWRGATWQETSDGFQVWFDLLARLSPLDVRDGKLVLRRPGSGLGDLDLDRARMALVFVVLGGTSFDGLERTTFWADSIGERSGWEGTAINTFGLVWAIAVVAAIYLSAVRLAQRLEQHRGEANLSQAFATSLVPIAFGYSIAHYFSALVFDGQSTLIRISDPYADGSDLFGTATWRTNFSLVSTTTIAWVQALGIIGGHVAAVVVAHDRALELHDDPQDAIRSQYALLVAMVGFTVIGLVLLLSAWSSRS